MRFVLKSGRNVEVIFNYEYHEVPIKKLEYLYAIQSVIRDIDGNIINTKDCPTEAKPHITKIKIKIGGSELRAEAKCHKNDIFCKDKGRKIVWSKLTKGKGIKLGDFLSKEERRELFLKVFPRYNPYFPYETQEQEQVEMQKFKETMKSWEILSNAETNQPDWVDDIKRGISNLGSFIKEKLRG